MWTTQHLAAVTKIIPFKSSFSAVEKKNLAPKTVQQILPV